jgi:two-component system OmpR family sensor kinase
VADVPPNPATVPADLQLFAAAVAHEIRTPLSAAAGEAEIALRRDRSAAEYRDALRRIAGAISELVEISGDLTLLSEPIEDIAGASRSAALDAVLSKIRERYAGRDDVEIAVGPAPAARVGGSERYLARALTLIVEHALRHRRAAARVAMRIVAVTGSRVRLAIDAQPPGIWPRAWTTLQGAADQPDAPLRLRTARRIVEGSGGAVVPAGADAVHIELQRTA